MNMQNVMEYALFFKSNCLMTGSRDAVEDLRLELIGSGLKGGLEVVGKPKYPPPGPKRGRDALMISDGASNLSGMAHALIAACKETHAEGAIAGEDPAVKLIVSQMAFAAGIWNGVGPWASGDFFDCRARLREGSDQ